MLIIHDNKYCSLFQRKKVKILLMYGGNAMENSDIEKLIELVHKYNILALCLDNNGEKITIKNSKKACNRSIKNESKIEKNSLLDNTKEKTEITEEKVIKAPLVGIFYSASSAESKNFVEVGDRVVKGQVLAIIEAMKLMNEIKSDQDGIIETILAENGQMVEFGQPLFIMK